MLKQNVSRAFLVLASFLLFAEMSSADPNAVFKKLEGLVGNWQGTYQWVGGPKTRGSARASYSLTGNGSALVENLIYEKDTVMTSVYHMDAGTLRMTNFCPPEISQD